jgi:hypothetical protein
VIQCGDMLHEAGRFEGDRLRQFAAILASGPACVGSDPLVKTVSPDALGASTAHR